MRDLKIEEVGQVYGAGGIGRNGADDGRRRNNSRRSRDRSRRDRTRDRSRDRT